MAYLITDMLWGILDSHHLITILFIDTSIHFIAMAAAVMLWTRYVISYLEVKNHFSSILYYSGSIFLGLVVLTVLGAARTIRAMTRSDAKKIPVIALTANAFEEDVQRSMEAGLNAHLSKPVEPEVLFGTLEDLIVRQQVPEK